VRRHLAARLGQSLIVVFIATTIRFFIIRLAPGDPFSYESSNITPAVRQHLREQYGYDRPIPEQFVRYVTGVARGELGYSFGKHQFVSRVLAEAVPRTLLLVGVGLGLSLVLGVIVGVVQATRRNSVFDRLSSAALVTLYSLPDFWAALMIALIFGFWWPVLPAAYMVNPVTHDYLPAWGAFLDRVRHLILPASTLALLTMAAIARYQRAAMLEVLPAEYIRTARAKGLSERQIIWRHAFRNSLTPMVTLLGLMLPALLGGVLFIEKVFSWPGMGMLAADAIAGRDYDLVTATVVIGSVMVVIGNLLADLLHMAIDPRVRE
jgi:peptide/nickel transport system permease protein